MFASDSCEINHMTLHYVFSRIDHKYSPKEREVFRVLLEAIVMSGTYGSVSSTDALHLNVPNASLGPGAMQDLLSRLIADQWFIETVSCVLWQYFVSKL